jgi:GNAT superfamily N-acetyltransferase
MGTAMPVEIAAAHRRALAPLFQNCRYDRVLIDSVLEGLFGSAFADSAGRPTVARLDSGAFTLLAGNPRADAAQALLRLAPIDYVTPQNDPWRRLLREEFGDRISALPFTDFSPAALDPVRLEKLIATLPPAFELGKIDGPLAERLPADTGNAYFFENYASVDDFLGRGAGYVILYGGSVVSAAAAMAQSSRAIDVEIETVPDFRKRGLGTVVGAKLVSHCLARGIEPRWLAANAASERLALKLGYVRGETYETFALRS